MMTTISIFRDTFAKEPMAEAEISVVLENIKNGMYEKDIEFLRKIRTEKGESYYKNAKRSLTAVTFSGRFSQRNNNDPTFNHSRVLLADIDGVGDRLEELRRSIEADQHTAFCFISPSGDGLKVGVWFSQKPTGDVEHKRCFSFVEDYFLETFGVKIDRSCKDIARLCYVSHDPLLYRNKNATPFDIPPEIKKRDVSVSCEPRQRIYGDVGEEFAIGVLERACQAIQTAYPGEKHNTRLRISRLIGGYIAGRIIRESDAYERLCDAVIASGTPDRDLDAAFKTIRDGIEYGRAYPITAEQIETERENYFLNQEKNISDELTHSLDSSSNIIARLVPENFEGHFCENNSDNGGKKIKASYQQGNNPDSHVSQVAENAKYLKNSNNGNNSNRGNKGEQYGNNRGNNTVTTAQDTVNITSIVNEFILDSIGWFQTRDVYDAVGARTAQTKGAIRKALHKFSNNGILERNQTKNGGYRRIDKEAQLMDFMNCETEECSDFILPLGIHNMVSIMPGNIVLIAGSPNSGKTSLLLNIARYNMENYKVHYWNSEMDAAELKLRMEKFDIPLSRWKECGFEPRIKYGNFQDVIKPGVGVINIIDFLEIHDEFYAVGGIIRAIYEKLDGAICVVAVQKDKGRDLGRGGMFTIEKPRLALAVDYYPEKKHGTVKIVKAKNFKSGINPNGMMMDFNIVDGAKLIERQGWHR